MHIISRRRLREFWEKHADAEEPLRRWFTLARDAEWKSFGELKASCPSADRVEHLTVINIGGNKYRLIVEVFFRDQVVLVRDVLTHIEYDRGDWKKREPAPKREGKQRGDSTDETNIQENGKSGSRRRHRNG